jgi:hypothetical protein
MIFRPSQKASILCRFIWTESALLPASYQGKLVFFQNKNGLQINFEGHFFWMKLRKNFVLGWFEIWFIKYQN